MPRQIAARILLVCAVLLAQQTALAHDFWHAAAHPGSPQSKNTDGKKLCDLHDLLGTVLGAVSAALPQAVLLSLSDAAFAATAWTAPQARPLAVHSRGPPALS